MNTAIHVIDEITQKSRAKAKEPNVSIPELIKRFLRKRGDSTRHEIKNYLVKNNDVVAKSVYNAIGRLVDKKELFVRWDNGVELISLRAPALYDDDDFEATLRREFEENLNRVAAYPHRDWNMLSGGGLIRGALTGFVSPTSTGKTHFTAAVAAKAIEEGNTVCIISTEAKASKYVDLINKTITKKPKPSGTYEDLQGASRRWTTGLRGGCYFQSGTRS